MEALACFCWVRAAVCHRLALLYKHASGWAYEWELTGVCLPPLHCSVSLLGFDCLTVGRLFSETQTPRLWFMRGRSGRGYMRRENNHQHAQTHTYHNVMLQIHTSHMSLTLFITLMPQWKWTAEPNDCKTCMPLEWSAAHARSHTGKHAHMYAHNLYGNCLGVEVSKSSNTKCKNTVLQVKNHAITISLLSKSTSKNKSIRIQMYL